MPKLLVIDDETAMRELLYDTLTRKGFDVTTVSSGEQALELMKTQRPEAIVLDSRMPGLSGVQTAQRIREFDQGVPIVLLRGGDAEVTDEALTQLGIAEVVRKELGVELFLSAVDLSLKRLREPARANGHAAGDVGGTILVTDDDPQVRRLLQAFFERRGLTVVMASCGEEALQALRRKPQAVILDLNMPGMDGLMTLRKIKAAHPKMPVIMATGVDDHLIVREALDAGAYDYVTKPFNLDYLETVVLTKVLLGMDG